MLEICRGFSKFTAYKIRHTTGGTNSKTTDSMEDTQQEYSGDPWTERALVTACREGDLSTAASLVTSGNVNGVVDSRTPLITAIHYQQQELVEMILEVEEVEVNKTVAGWTALHEACFTNNVLAIQAVIRSDKGVEMNLEDGDGYTPIMIAIWFDKIEAVKELLAHKEVELVVDGQEIEELAG